MKYLKPEEFGLENDLLCQVKKEIRKHKLIRISKFDNLIFSLTLLWQSFDLPSIQQSICFCIFNVAMYQWWNLAIFTGVIPKIGSSLSWGCER